MAIAATSAKFRKIGDTLDYTPGSAVSAGDIIKVDGLLCIASGTSRRTRPAFSRFSTAARW